MKENLISQLVEKVVKSYFNGVDIKELIDNAKKKLKEGIENEAERREKKVF